jgi:hypothetical protein
VAVPALGRTKPRIMRIVVVFPDPFGPRKPVTTPRETSKLKVSTATCAPKRFVSRFATITGDRRAVR